MNISLIEINNLDYLLYLEMRRDAYIYKLSQSEAGNEYLDNAWRLEQTKIDPYARKRLKSLFGGGNNGL